jgi:DNA-directed RNA polymerase specialized sigma24 family protein
MEISEVAETLGIPPGTVKSRLHYATQRLAREWRDAEDD